MLDTLSRKIRHFFHVVSNIRPIVWICLYVFLMPVFAFIYWGLPDTQFRIPDGAGTDYWSWLYYSIVTITTLGFGDYTPAHVWAQIVTAVEVMCGLVILGFFLNAVGSMKSEIDVESEIEKQKQAHFSMEKEKLMLCIPTIMHTLNTFLSYCYAVTTPLSKRNSDNAQYNPDFTFADMADLFKPSGLPFDNTRLPAVARLIKCSTHTSLNLDSLQNRIDLTLWPDVLENCFAFVANYQMFSSADSLSGQAIDLLKNATVSGTEAEKKLS
ncbi:MAG: potassium channel family protein, partial [Muribaculaceae bacterium]|nr:potassium channel family protein [Muribaculaceae bacterium]